MKSKNSIPAGLDDTIRLAVRALAGAREIGASIGLMQNSADRIETDLFALTGHEDPAGSAGAQHAFSVQLADLSAARRGARSATQAARLFCQRTIGILKHRFGNQWNSRWHETGLSGNSLAVPYDPMPMLVLLRAYLGAHPELENAPLALTAAAGQTIEIELTAARLAVSAAKAGRLSKKRTRDSALRRLQKRLSGLRAELAQLLDAADGAWLSFGFARPAAGRIPEPVDAVKVTAIGAEHAVVEWTAAPRAQYYRVSWKAADEPGAAPTEIGVVQDLSLVARNLPAEGAIAFEIYACNRSGESKSVVLWREAAVAAGE